MGEVYLVLKVQQRTFFEFLYCFKMILYCAVRIHRINQVDDYCASESKHPLIVPTGPATADSVLPAVANAPKTNAVAPTAPLATPSDALAIFKDFTSGGESSSLIALCYCQPQRATLAASKRGPLIVSAHFNSFAHRLAFLRLVKRSSYPWVFFINVVTSLSKTLLFFSLMLLHYQ